ncbi:MAG: efflux transporter outer membrane subunit [Nevskia sp.]|nr:efflux transporter outer membrane subunit [Nevskia sp.]
MKRTLPLACGLLAGATLGACTLGPDFAHPDPPSGGYSQAAPPAGSARTIAYGAEVADDWYRLFHSDALNELVRQALTGSPDLEAARHGLLAAQQELRAVAGTALPQIGASGDITRAHINGSYLYAPVQAIDTTANQFSIGPTLAYKLDVFGGVRRSVEAQQAAAAAARDQALNTYITLVDQVVVTAFDYAASRAQIETTRALVDELQSQYELTQKLENAGKITRSDTLQAQTEMENIRATLPALEQQRDTYRNALAQLCGRTPDEFAMPELRLADFTLPAQLPLSLPSALVRQRPDVLASEDNLHQASAEIGVAQAARLPSLSISGQYAQQATKLNQLFTQPGGIWSAGLDVSAPLFSGGTLAARADEAKERYQQAQASYRGAVIAAFVEVADALQALQHDADGYAAHARALGAARASRDLALEQYRAGKYNELQVLTVEQQYENAALSQVQADVQRFTDTAALFRALGGGWWNAPQDAAALPVAAAGTTDGTSRRLP